MSTVESQVCSQMDYIDLPPVSATRATAIVSEYLLQRLQVYQELCDIRTEHWGSEKGDAWFQKQRQQADHADDRTKTGFFGIMRSIGLELDAATSGLTINRAHKPRHAILDLCMAPGGFSGAALHRNPTAIVRGISLPPGQGGHDMLLRKCSDIDPNSRIFVDFRDITLLSEEMGVPLWSIPPKHPDAQLFSSDRPFYSEGKFDLVFCDGQVLRTQERGEHRQYNESTRLLTSQLVLALQRIRSGGTMVVLMHRADTWRSVKLIHTFSRFSERVQLHKPLRAHKIRSSFYMVAQGVKPGTDMAKQAVKEWKEQWKEATFLSAGEADGTEKGKNMVWCGDNTEREINAVLDDFGDTFIGMVESVFKTQAVALRNAPWARKSISNECQ